MASWKQALIRLSVDVERQYDLLKNRFRERLGLYHPIMIAPYRGYGTPERMFLRGRVLKDRNIPPAQEDDSSWENLLNMWRRANSVEVPHARVLVRFGGEEQIVTANVEGFFEVWIEPSQPLPTERLWHEVELELVEPASEDGEPIRAVGEILVPPPDVDFVVISDIDDTVLQSNVTSLLKMARATFLGNARLRLPFPGVAAFYRALHRGRHSDKLNPMFYVSSSPWNLYDLLSEFFNLQEIPIGPVLFLRDWGLTDQGFLPLKNRAYKLSYIKEIIDTFKDLPFILIGDSSQEDPEIYSEVVALYPDRIKAVYIRNVSRDPRRLDEISELAEEVLKAGSALLLAETTLPLAEHAAKQGWIDPDALPEIEIEKQADAAPPTPLETLLGQDEKAEGPTVEVAAGADAQEMIEAVQDGGIEEALHSGDPKKQEAPTVVVQPDDPQSPDKR
jgi:phosphatidate phosphatase APP1